MVKVREAQFGRNPWVGRAEVPKVLKGVTDDGRVMLGTSALPGEELTTIG